MIQFRCSYCHRKFGMKDELIGTEFSCGTCRRQLRVPKRNQGNSRVRTRLDWLIEFVLCGGAGAILGFCLAVFVVLRLGLPFRFMEARLTIVASCVLVGFILGALGGIRGLDWMGRRVRKYDQERETWPWNHDANS